MTRDKGDKVEILQNEIRTIRENAEALGEQLAEQARKLEAMLSRVRGTAEIAPRKPIDPARPYFVGDEGTYDELFDAVMRCISERPHTLREIVELTGCTNRNRVSGILVKIQVKHPGAVKNLGSKKIAWWFMPKMKKSFSTGDER